MAYVTEHVKYTYTLHLTEDEAIWLKAYVQNALVQDEGSETQLMRQKFFEELARAGVN